MSAPSDLSPEQAQSLAAFDTARKTFLAAFSKVPDEAFTFVPAGDEYALGTLLMHLCDPIDRYLDQLERMRRADFGPVDLPADAERSAREEHVHLALVAARPTGADRARLLAELDAAHDRVRATMAALDGETFTRQAPVIYSAGSAPLPTSARDITGWLAGHYDEHTAQVQTMLAQWHAQPRG